MHFDHQRITLVAASVLALVATTAAAQAPLRSLDPQTTLKEWGQVLFCREAYRHPDNASRVYDYDLRQCEAAETALLQGLGGMTPDTRAELRRVAQGEAARIRANTRDIGQVLGACREACTRLAGAAADADPGPHSEPAAEPDS